MKELVEHFSGALIVISDMSELETQSMLGISDYKLLAQKIKQELEKIDPGKGKIFGVFHSETESVKFRRQVAARARDLKWYEAYGVRTPRGQWKSPYKSTSTQVKNLDLEAHPEFAGQDDDGWVVKVLRLPLDNHPAES